MLPKVLFLAHKAASPTHLPVVVDDVQVREILPCRLALSLWVLALCSLLLCARALVLAPDDIDEFGLDHLYPPLHHPGERDDLDLGPVGRWVAHLCDVGRIGCLWRGMQRVVDKGDELPAVGEEKVAHFVSDREVIVGGPVELIREGSKEARTVADAVGGRR